MAENVDNSRKAMAPEGWERHRHLGSCPAGQGCRGGPAALPRTRRLGQGAWAEAPGLPGPAPRATRPSGGGSGLGPAMPGLHPVSLSLLVYEMGVLAGRISWSVMGSACGTPEVLPACLLERSDHLRSCSSREGQRGRASGAHSRSPGSGREDPASWPQKPQGGLVLYTAFKKCKIYITKFAILTVFEWC